MLVHYINGIMFQYVKRIIGMKLHYVNGTVLCNQNYSLTELHYIN